MSDHDFAPLPGLTFVEPLPGSGSLARYRRETADVVVVERRPSDGTPADPKDFPANGTLASALRVESIHVLGAFAYLVYAEDAACALPARIHDRAWHEEDRLAALADVAAALRAIHAQGLVHGDLTPDAVLLAKDGRVRLTAVIPPKAPSSTMSAKPDEARTFGPTLNRIRATGGALAYLAPEQFMANATLAESDVFAWGCIAYEVATGRPPFGFVTDPAKLLEAITRGPQRAVHELSPRFSASFDAVVRATLSVERQRRTLPELFPADLLTSEVARSVAPASTAVRATPRWILPTVVALIACAALAYFAAGR